MALKWKNEYRTGVEQIDEQHRRFFNILNRMEQLIYQGNISGPKMDDVLTILGTDAYVHFRFEENCITQHRCEIARKNKKAHDQFLRLIQEFQSNYKRKRSSESFFRKFHKLAESWVLSHICKIDSHIKSCLHEAYQS